MRLVHWSVEPLGEIRDRTAELRVDRKPRGLWVSDESGGAFGWREWCEGEQVAWLHEHVYEVELAPDASVLLVRGAGDLDGFHMDWSVETDARYGRTDIDWPRLAEHYDGVIITPYVWSRRLDGEVSDWYYGWDCASGCIWRPRAIDAIRAVEEMEPA